jgi:hypothetical protein
MRRRDCLVNRSPTPTWRGCSKKWLKSAVISVIGVNPVLAFGTVATAAILVDRNVTMLDDRLPAAQNRAAHRLGGVGQPGARMIEFVRRIGGGAVRRVVKDDRPRRY